MGKHTGQTYGWCTFSSSLILFLLECSVAKTVGDWSMTFFFVTGNTRMAAAILASS
jgi:hypothetical protein